MSQATPTCPRTTSPPRTPGWRRIGAWPVSSDADVEDIGSEWADRYGPLPGPAVGLLALARLRTAAMARGIREITMSNVRRGGSAPPVARIFPVHLTASAEVRLRRLVPGATYREDLAQLLIPIRPGALPADVLRELLEGLIAPEDIPPADAVANPDSL
jgi:transcription-repair coupling factor (superfamily II helicase)